MARSVLVFGSVELARGVVSLSRSAAIFMARSVSVSAAWMVSPSSCSRLT